MCRPSASGRRARASANVRFNSRSSFSYWKKYPNSRRAASSFPAAYASSALRRASASIRFCWIDWTVVNAKTAQPISSSTPTSTVSRLLPLLLRRTRGSPHEQQLRGPHEDDKVKPEVRLQDVLNVVLDPLLEVLARLARALQLPQAGDARTDAQTQVAPGRAVLVLIVWAGPGSDQAHLADQDVPELGQFIEVGLAEDAPDSRHARIVRDEHLRTVSAVVLLKLARCLLGVPVHRPELPAGEHLPASTL